MSDWKLNEKQKIVSSDTPPPSVSSDTPLSLCE